MLMLVRHGETDANARGLLLGRADPPLSEVGRLQARALAAAVPVGARVVASPLRRTRETAAELAPRYEVDERWVELDYGELDGVPVADVPVETWARWRDDITFVPAGGESLSMLGARVREACDELLAELCDGADVVVVSHVSPIKAAIAWALGTGDEITWRMFVALASIARIGVTPAGPRLLSFNERIELQG